MSRAKIYPRIVCGLWTHRKKDSGRKEEIRRSGEMLRLCHRGIELLRDTGRMYFLWELLCIHRENAKRLRDLLKSRGEDIRAEALEPLLREDEERIRVLEEICKEYHVPKETTDLCYMYLEKEVYCIGDVVRLRRNMLGMTKRQLCDGICSEKTLARLEKNKTRMQRSVTEELFGKLGLEKEYYRRTLLTGSTAAREREIRLRTAINERQGQEADHLIRKLEAEISMESRLNRQAMLRHRAVNDIQEGRISPEEGRLRITEALECTLPYEAAMAKGEKYFTNEEPCASIISLYIMKR